MPLHNIRQKRSENAGAQVDDAAFRLEIRDLVRRYGGRAVVDGVSLTVAAGQVACLLGPSGCGKSTTLRLVAGVESQDSGEILIDGQRVSGGGVAAVPPERRGIGLMFQDFALFPHLRVAENVGFGLSGGRAQNARRVSELLERVGLERSARAYPHELSGGEQQRAALARALAPRPAIMLMDEPFSGLDNRLRDGIRDETLEILREQNAAVLLVTHEPHEAMRMADSIVLMRNGRVVQQGAPYHVYSAPADRQAMAFFSDVNIVRGKSVGALVQTPFGPFLAPTAPEGSEVEIAVRPQHLKIELDRGGRGPAPTIRHGTAVRGVVERARFMGAESLVEFRMDHDGSVFRATVPNVFVPQPGTPMWLMVRRDRCMLFPAQGG